MGDIIELHERVKLLEQNVAGIINLLKDKGLIEEKDDTQKKEEKKE